MLKARYEFDEVTEPCRYCIMDHWKAAFIFCMENRPGPDAADAVVIVLDDQTLKESYFRVSETTGYPFARPFHTTSGVGNAPN